MVELLRVFMGTPPDISIVTPCLNRSALISDAIQSVLDQRYDPIEHIIVDGGSTDGTLENLQAFPHLTVISEPDSGMYNAINKGIRLARGEVIGVLNSDDLYEPHVFAKVVQTFREHPLAQAVVGHARVFRDRSGVREDVKRHPWTGEQDLWRRLTLGGLNSNAWFFRRRLFDEIGYFDERLRFSADREFLFRMAARGIHYAPLEIPVYMYRLHAGSSTFNPLSSRDPQRAQTRMRVLQEGMLVSESYLTRPGLQAAARRHLRSLHDDRAYRLTATALYHRRWSTALGSALRGWRHNIFWPLVFLRRSFQRLLGFLRPA